MSTDSPRTGFAHSPRRRWLPYLIVVAVVALLGVSAWWLSKSAASSQPPPGRGGGGGFGGGGRGGGLPMPVGAAPVAKGDIKVTLDALGTVTPLRNVTVTAQVAGQLLDVKFKEGQLVNQGDWLAQIDPRPYQAALEQAQGALVKDRALLAEAKIDLDRYQTLFKQDSIAKQQLDSQASLVQQYEGQVKSDQGQIDTARVNVDYTKILAPVSGRVGLRQIDPGNNVAVGTTLLVVTQLKPIDVLFTIPEDNLPAVLKKLHSGAAMTADVYDRAGTTKLASGALASLDNQVDTSTGTVKAKAEFANDDEGLFPNQFVNVNLLLDTLHDATVIPTSALERGANGLFVYIVQPDKTVAVRDIVTGPTEGERVAVSHGLSVGEVVVTSGADRLREGSRVELPGDSPPPAASATPSAAGANRQPGQWRQGQGGAQGSGQHRRRDAAAGNGNATPANGAAAPAADAGAKPAQDQPAENKP